MNSINNPYPLGYKITHFRQARRYILASSQTTGPIWQFRWGTADGHICVVKRVILKGLQFAASTAEELQYTLKVARTYTAVDSSNVASILRSGDMQKLNGDFTDSVLTAFAESNSASAASGGTYTLDTDGIAAGSFTTVAATPPGPLGSQTILDYNPMTEDHQFLRLEKDEGFVIKQEVTKGASQGFALHLEVAWAECLKVA